MCVIPKCCSVYTDLAARAPPIKRLAVIEDGRSVFAASDINAILSRICSSLTYKIKEKNHGKKKNMGSVKIQQKS